MLALAALLSASLLTGCTVVEDPFATQLSASGIERLVATVEEGDLSLAGGGGDTIALSGRTYGVATKQDRAAELEDAAGFSLDQQGSDLVLTAWSGGGMSGVDVDLVVPGGLASDLYLENGTARLEGLVGWHVVTAERIEARNLGGQLDLGALGGGMDLVLAPAPGDHVTLYARGGDVDLTLPWGLDYDLQVWGDPEHELVIEDLGFDHQAMDVAYFAGLRGRGTIHVDLVVEGGDVHIDDGGWW